MFWLGMLSFSVFLIIVGLALFAFGLGVKILKGLVELTGAIIFGIYDHFSTSKKMKGYISEDEKQKINAKVKVALELREEKNRQYEGLYYFINRLKEKYPHADSELLKKIEKEYFSCDESNAVEYYENMVRESHCKNIPAANKSYTSDDLKGILSIDTKYFNNARVDVYKIDYDFVVRVINSSTRDEFLFQSRNERLVREFLQKIKFDYTNMYYNKPNKKSISIEELKRGKLFF